MPEGCRMTGAVRRSVANRIELPVCHLFRDDEHEAGHGQEWAVYIEQDSTVIDAEAHSKL
jgi:hypothetical protein